MSLILAAYEYQDTRPGQIVSEIKLDWSETEDKEVQKIAYKRQILEELGLNN